MEDIKEFFRFFNDDKIIDSFNFNFLKFFLLEDTIINHLRTTKVFESPYDQIYEIYSKNFRHYLKRGRIFSVESLKQLLEKVL